MVVLAALGAAAIAAHVVSGAVAIDAALAALPIAAYSPAGAVVAARSIGQVLMHADAGSRLTVVVGAGVPIVAVGVLTALAAGAVLTTHVAPGAAPHVDLGIGHGESAARAIAGVGSISLLLAGAGVIAVAASVRASKIVPAVARRAVRARGAAAARSRPLAVGIMMAGAAAAVAVRAGAPIVAGGTRARLRATIGDRVRACRPAACIRSVHLILTRTRLIAFATGIGAAFVYPTVARRAVRARGAAATRSRPLAVGIVMAGAAAAVAARA